MKKINYEFLVKIPVTVEYSKEDEIAEKRKLMKKHMYDAFCYLEEFLELDKFPCEIIDWSFKE